MRPAAAWLLVAVLAAALFCGLAVATMEGGMTGFDDGVRLWVHARASPLLTAIAQTVTWFGTLGVLALFGTLAAIGFLRARQHPPVLLLAMTMAGAVVLENGLKFAFRRPRPAPFFGTDPVTYSFPSGHALFSLCFYGVLVALVARRVRAPAAAVAICTATIVLVAAIGASRIYLGVHYPSDVLGGYLVATAWVAVVRVWRQKDFGGV